MAVFLTEVSARHAILRKDKRVSDHQGRIGTQDGRLTGTGTKDVPVEVEDGGLDILDEDDQDGKVLNLKDIPMAIDQAEGRESSQKTQNDEEDLFLSDRSGDDMPHSNGEVYKPSLIDAEDAKDDKKKMALNTIYDGFSIYGRILCMVVKRRGGTKGKELARGSGQAMMEEWIASTQMGEGRMMDE